MPRLDPVRVFIEEPGTDWPSLLFRAHAGKQIAMYSMDPHVLRQWLYQVAGDLATVIRALQEAHDAHHPE